MLSHRLTENYIFILHKIMWCRTMLSAFRHDHEIKVDRVTTLAEYYYNSARIFTFGHSYHYRSTVTTCLQIDTQSQRIAYTKVYFVPTQILRSWSSMNLVSKLYLNISGWTCSTTYWIYHTLLAPVSFIQKDSSQLLPMRFRK